MQLEGHPAIRWERFATPITAMTNISLEAANIMGPLTVHENMWRGRTSNARAGM